MIPRQLRAAMIGCGASFLAPFLILPIAGWIVLNWPTLLRVVPNVLFEICVLATVLGPSLATVVAIVRLRGSVSSWPPAAARDYVAGDTGTLLEALVAGNRYTRPATYDSLAKLLPRMAPEDVESLSPLHRRRLVEELTPANVRRQPEFILAALTAVVQVGDHAALGAVRAIERSARDPGIRRAALDAAGEIRLRLEALSRTSTLLRPSTSPTQDAALLLRPGGANATDDGSMLLRSG